MKAASSEDKAHQEQGNSLPGPVEGTAPASGPLDGSAEAKRLAAAILEVLAGPVRKRFPTW